MKSWFDLSIRTKLLVLLVAALLPALGIILYTGLEQRQAAVEEVHMDARILVETLAEQQVQLTTSINSMFHTLARMPGVQAMDFDACSTILADLLQTMPLRNIGIFDPQGDLRVSARPLDSLNIAHTPLFQEAAAQDDMAAGQLVKGHFADKPAFRFAYPLRDEQGELQAVFRTGYLLNRFDHMFDRAQLPADTVMAVIDRNGRRLHRYPYTDKFPRGELIPEHLWPLFSSDEPQGTFEALGGDGRERLFAYHQLFLPGSDEPYMIFHVSVLKSEAQGQARQVLMRNLGFLVFSLLAAVGVAWTLSRRTVLAPIHTLLETARTLGRGNLSARTGMRYTPDELGQLAASFDHMAASLEKMTHRLSRAEEEYREIFQNAVEGIYQSIPEGKLIRVNPAMAEIFGYASPQEMLARVEDMGSQLYVDPAQREEFVQDLLSRGRSLDREMLCWRKDGEQIWVAINARLVLDREGRPGYIEGSCLDVTQRKKAEEEQEKLQAQLLQSQKMESVGRLAGGIAHDFNNMLQVILGHSERAMMKLEQEHPVTPSLQQIHDSSLRSKALVQQLLAFARKQKSEPRVLDLNEIISGLLSMLRRLIPENVQIRFTPADEPVLVRMDPSQLDQILVNLVVNSRDAIKGQGEISIETGSLVLNEPSHKFHADCAPGEYACLCVSDTGQGMDQDTLQKVFEPYFTTKEEGRGTGLGLSTVYGIVRQNSGGINIYSEPGQGTVIRIYLPRSGEEEAEATGQQEPLAAHGEATILLVEDDPTILEMTTEVLEEYGYTVLACKDPKQALDYTRSHPEPIHLLATDVIMPGMNGPRLQEQVVSLRPEIKSLFMSGYTADAMASNGGMRLRAHFLQKPFTLVDLLSKVGQVLQEDKTAGSS